ncbi:MAG: tripartite tricarboxylate transporter substrate binding protein [Betaproteobacteria bacterium]|nr:tripartite tricarboxylate transporter substrate binding protein [Betaproteobacteria bacterium]
MKRRNVCFGVVFAAILGSSLPPLPAQAQGKYPERAIRLVVPFPPGGGTDIMGRRLGAKLAVLLGQQVVIDNKTGANGSIGTAEVARAKPDGYTLLMGTTSTHSINPLTLTLEQRLYDPVKDFVHIALLGTSPFSVVVHPSVAGSLQELIKRVRASPGKYSYGSSGTGGSTHLAGELFKKLAGDLDIVHVPYRGSAQSILDLAGGQIPIVMSGFSSVIPFHRSGKVRILAAFNEKRVRFAPDIPTAIELGVKGMVAYTFNGFFAPAATPEPIIDQLSRATVKVMADGAFQKELEDLGIDAVTDSNPERANQFIKDELAKWAPIVKATGLAAQ